MFDIHMLANCHCLLVLEFWNKFEKGFFPKPLELSEAKKKTRCIQDLISR